LCSSAMTNPHQLQLIDLVRESLDEVVVDGYPLRRALLLIVVLYEDVGEFVPQLPLPVVFECEEVMLEVFWGGIPLLLQEVGDLLVVHSR
jgi:hypothetical protein